MTDETETLMAFIMRLGDLPALEHDMASDDAEALQNIRELQMLSPELVMSPTKLNPVSPLGYHCGGYGRLPSASSMHARTAMRLPGEMNDQLHDLAKRDAVSVTAIIRRAIAREIGLASR